MTLLSDRTISYWLPSIFDSVGGVQSFGRRFVKELEDLTPDARHQIVLKNDRVVPAETGFKLDTRYSCWGNVSETFRTPLFSLSVCSSAILARKPLVICGHAHFLPLALLLKRFFSIPYWAICYGVEAWNISRKGVLAGLKNADRVISISRFTQQRVIEQSSADKIRCSILPCTFDEGHFRILSERVALRKRYGFSEDDRILLTVNRLEAKESYKAYDQVLAALPSIRQSIPSVKYVIVGEGSDRARLEQSIADAGLSECVHLTGYVSSEELLHYYNLSDLFVLPSKLEGFGIVFLEALACGKAVIAGNQDGSKEAVSNGEFGILVNPDSTSELVESVVHYLKGEVSNSMLYQPDVLRRRVIEEFGTGAFRRRLKEIVGVSEGEL